MNMRPRLTYANVVASLALFVALGGSSYAAIELSKGSVKRKHLAESAVTSKKVKDGALLAKDFKSGQLPAGERGPAGPPGTVDVSQFFTKTQSDARYLAAGGKAADANTVDGYDGSVLLRGPLTERESDATADATSRSGRTVHCDSDEIAISGGARWGTAPDDWPITESIPSGDGGWTVTVYNPTATSQDWTAVAYCAKFDSAPVVLP